MPRVATHAIIAVEDMGYIHQYNTHIDYGVPEIQHRQLESLLSFIDENNNDINLPTVITGDFNMTSDTDNMRWFLSELKNRDINMSPSYDLMY